MTFAVVSTFIMLSREGFLRLCFTLCLVQEARAFMFQPSQLPASAGAARTLACRGMLRRSPPTSGVSGVLCAEPQPFSSSLVRRKQFSLVKTQAASSAAGNESSRSMLPVGWKPGDTPMGGCVSNLIKNIVGSGVLCLAGGVAAFSDQRQTLVLALGIAFTFAAIAGYCFAMIGKVCEMTGAKSYTEGWAKTVGESTAWIPNLIVVFKTWSACLIYSMIIGDLFSDLAITAGVSQVAGVAVNRNSILFVAHLFGLLPLCLLRSFTFLSYASFLGIGGLLFTAFFMILRLVEGSYAPGGVFFNQLVASGGKNIIVSSFDVMGTKLIKSLILISMLTNSYLCHYNAPKFLRELQDATRKRCDWMRVVYACHLLSSGLTR
mmetsp:Transcript_3314/g.7989  ORF Transcript_3314/g.7989 Transcript_3314/m.7989 type:complete len:377 (-) Transcript_3314:1791-2921(-)